MATQISQKTSGKASRKISERTNERRSVPLTKLPKRSYAARDRSLHVLSVMRANPKLSLSHAARLEGVKPATVRKYFSSALNKSDGTFRVSPSDRYAAVLYVPNADGKAVPVKTRGSKDREMLGQYLRDLGRYMRGDANALTRWRGKKVAGFELVTDEAAIIRMESVLSDFSLYRSIQ